LSKVIISTRPLFVTHRVAGGHFHSLFGLYLQELAPLPFLMATVCILLQ